MQNPYKEWLDENLIKLEDLPETKKIKYISKDNLLKQQKLFGYTSEDIDIVIKPMVENGIEGTGAMGDDTSLSILSEKPRLLYQYFKQLFAQVTNPPIDPIREEIIMAEDVFLGAEGNFLKEEKEHCIRLKLNRPIITNEEIAKIKEINKTGLKSEIISLLFKEEEGIRKTLLGLFKRIDILIEKGKTILILSDRGADENKVPIPALLACSAIHHHLIKQGTRTQVSLVIETAEAREIHHYAVLIGYGANAINPYLVFATIKNESS